VSVCPLVTTARIFTKFGIWIFVESLSRKFKNRKNMARIMRSFMKNDRPIHTWSYRSFFLKWKMFQTKVVEKIKTHVSYSIHFLSGTVYEIIWNKIVELSRPQTTIRRLCIACWITKATNMQCEYVILNAFPLQQRLHERSSTVRYKHTDCLVLIY
jgi:hypothetical protein